MALKPKWYQNVYRRNVVDMHITDIDPRFMGQFDAGRYVDMLALAQVQSAVVYAHSHAGLCFYPSQVGPMHGGLHGRDIVAEVVDRCHQRGIAVVLYFSLIYDTWAYRHHSAWRIIGADGKGVADHSRYGVCCPNSPYRDYAAAMVGEIARMFDVAGMRLDMTFWPAVCYCPHCQRRYAQEAGEDLPRIIDWQDPAWVRFARAREAWLVEFAALQTAAIRRANPVLTVEHQASTYTHNWQLGVTTDLVAQNDFLQGDFYGDALQGTFVRKLFYNLSPGRPAGFETSIGVDLRDYTALKAEELLEAKAFAALADGCAFVFIDAVDPPGTLNQAVYERMGRVFARTRACERYLGGQLCQDVAVYFSTASKFDPADNGKAVDDPHLSSRIPHLEAALGACKSLLDQHIPFGVISDHNLDQLSRHQVVVLPNVLMMGEREVAAFRAYVRAGGSLYASKYTSLVTRDGQRQDELMLADVLGVSYRGETVERFTYIAPDEGACPEPAEGAEPLFGAYTRQHADAQSGSPDPRWMAEPLFGAYTRQHPPGLPGTQLIVEARPGAQVLGRLVLPYTDPADPIRFASIHNNPPGIYTDRPAIVLNRFGKGMALYVAGNLEAADAHREVFIRLIRLLGGPFSFAAQAPKPVQVTLFHQLDRRRYLICLINFQKELPNIPVHDVRVRVRLADQVPRQLRTLPGEEALAYQVEDGELEFVIPRLETFAMCALDYTQ